jgi:hypothetical protein
MEKYSFGSHVDHSDDLFTENSPKGKLVVKFVLCSKTIQ